MINQITQFAFKNGDKEKKRSHKSESIFKRHYWCYAPLAVSIAIASSGRKNARGRKRNRAGYRFRISVACPFFLFIHKLVQTCFPCLALMVCMIISPNFLLDSCNPPIFAFEPGVYLAFAWPLRLLHACFSIHLLLPPVMII